MLSIFDGDFSLIIRQFDSALLWAAIICLLGTLLTGTILIAYAESFGYGIKNENQLVWNRFSILDLEIPDSKSKFEEITFNISEKTRIMVIKSLRADYGFMPFLYGFLVFTLLCFHSHLSANFYMRRLNLNLYYTIVALLPLLAYLFDFFENRSTINLLNETGEIKAAEGTSKYRLKTQKTEFEHCIKPYYRKIKLFSTLKWVFGLLSGICVLFYLILLFVYG